ncbi:MAG: bifunctional metallophosphatase/5'-nucleotidase [Eubacteriaceae bacterium]|nr:bifunctional metallophosphatase/5'-nucleotidase [Eubacteriaceae bacterium]
MDNRKKLTILHSNDLHGDFFAEELEKSLVGGVSLLSGYVNKVREEEKNTIYAIAGDMFRGSVIDSEFQGISTIEIMNMLSPDVVTVGNHETDYGIAHLLFLEKCAKFPIINANLHIKTNNARLFKPHHIIQIDGMKILFIGIVTEEVISQTKNDGLIGSFVDIKEAADEIGKICNTYNSLDVDLTVLLTHIGHEEDKHLASLLDPAWGVDIIIGGHSHTFLEEPAVVNDIVIVQAGTGTDEIGRFDIVVDMDNNCIDSYTWKTVPVNAENCPHDAEMEEIIKHYKDKTDEKYGRLITRFRRQLTHPSRTQETALGGLIADSLRESLGLDIMLLGSGSLRCEAMGPMVLLKDLTEAFPYDDAVYMFTVNGKQLKDMIRFMVRDEVWEGAHCEFYQFSEGLRVVYDRSTHEYEEFTFEGMDVTEERLYRVGLQNFHFKNIEEFFNIPLSEIEKNGKARIVSTSCRDVIEEYLSEHRNLDREISGRLVVK